MNALSETIVELLDRMRRRPPSRWALRGLLVLCGAAAEIWLLLVAGASPWAVVASIAIVAGAVFARGVVPLLTAAVIVVQAALAALRRNAGELRHQVAKGLNLKYAPQLRFQLDETFDRMDDTRRMFADERVRRDVEAHDDDETDDGN